MIGLGSRGQRRAGLALLAIAALLAPLVAPMDARAQDDKRTSLPTWDDAPIVPLHQSEADWLFDAGWKTETEAYGPFPTRTYTVGDSEDFIPLGSLSHAVQPFTLRFRTEHAYYWFERDIRVNMSALEETARFFEERLWPLSASVFGDAWTPGIDGDPRLHIVNQEYIGPGVMGAFNPADQCPRAFCPDSNQREILYINLDLAPLNSEAYLTTLVHELQHLIQHHMDGNESRWLNEGLSQLAEHLSGFHPRAIGGDNLVDFLRDPDLQLNTWALNGNQASEHYAASYLFLVYLYESLGLDFIRALARDPYDGMAAVAHTLSATGQSASADDIFADWMVANWLDDPYAADGRYYYQSLDLPTRILPYPLVMTGQPLIHADTVSQYGADYLGLNQPGSYNLSFDGSDEVAVIGTPPQSGDWMWWSYNNDSSAARLTGTFDLTGLSAATLEFSAWWDTEADYDWFQVLVSTNGGQTWEIVRGDRAIAQGAHAPGPHYSGHSPYWVTEQIDLSRYAGGAVMIRFEYLTDGSQTFSGVALDDIRIPEIGAEDGGEDPFSAWTAEGFMRIPAAVAQGWAVATITTRPGAAAVVQRMALNDLNTGHMMIEVPQGGSVTLVIGAMAPFATARAAYKLVVQPH